MLLRWNNIFHDVNDYRRYVVGRLVVATALAALSALTALTALAALAALAALSALSALSALTDRMALAGVALAASVFRVVSAMRHSVLATVGASIFTADNAASSHFAALTGVFSFTEAFSHGVYKY